MAAAPGSLFPDIQDLHDPGCKVKTKVPAHWVSAAKFSPCHQYRYVLTRRWDDRDAGYCMFCMMNPSGADEKASDQTVSKCCRMAKRWGFSGIHVTNVCAYRATENKRLLSVADPVGPENIAIILETAKASDQIVIAHGNLPGKLQKYADAAVDALLKAGHDLYVLGLSDNEVPVHPLARGKHFIPEETEPRIWRYGA